MSTSSSQCESSSDSHGSPAMARHAALPRSLETTEPDAHDDQAQDSALDALSDLRISTGPSLQLTKPRDTNSIAPMDLNSLSARSSTIARRQLSGGGIAGAVVGSVVGAALILLCVSPFLLRRRRHARARREQAELQAEMGLAAETAPGRGESVVASPATDRRLSVDHFGRPSAGDAQPQVKDYDMDGNSYDNVTPSGTAVPQYAAAFTAPPHGDEGDGHAPQAGAAAPPPLAMPPPPAPMPASTDQAQPPRKSSLSNAIEGLAEKATALFHRSSTRSSSRSVPMVSPTRSPTMHMDTTDDVPMPTFSEQQTYSPVMMTGAAAEYFSGAPLSPPESEYSPPPQATFGGSTEAGATPMNFMSMPRAAILAKFEAPSRQGSQADDFSPMSPTSPGMIKSEPEEDEGGARGLPTTPMMRMRRNMPSPPHPAPGTVNPMDVWAPANASERGHRVAAELDQMQESPPPQAASPPMQVYHSVVEEQQPFNGQQTFDEQQAFHEQQSFQEHQYQQQPTIVEPEPENRPDEFIAHETDVSTPAPGSQSSVPSTYTTPDTRLTEPTPAYMTTPSPHSNEASTPAHSSVSGSSPRTFTCEECGRTFDQVHKLNHHKRYHERPHECTHQGCGKRFGTKTHLDRHINDKHKKTRKYHCTIADCAYSKQGGKSFPRKDNWRRHMQNKHNLNPEHDPVEVVDEAMTGT